MSRLIGKILTGIALVALSASIHPLRAIEPFIGTVAGGGPDGIPALHANLAWPLGVAVDSHGIPYFTADQRVYRLEPSGVLRAVAGVGGDHGLFAGDGLPALNATLYYPSGLAFDAAGNLLISDTFSLRVRRVDAVTGIITTYAGGGANNPGDGGPATAARRILTSSSGLSGGEGAQAGSTPSPISPPTTPAIRGRERPSSPSRTTGRMVLHLRFLADRRLPCRVPFVHDRRDGNRSSGALGVLLAGSAD